MDESINFQHSQWSQWTAKMPESRSGRKMGKTHATEAHQGSAAPQPSQLDHGNLHGNVVFGLNHEQSNLNKGWT